MWGLVYSCVFTGSKRLSLLIALFFNNFEAKATVPFVLFFTQLSLNCCLVLPCVWRLKQLWRKNCSINRCFQHNDNQIFSQRRGCSITNQGLRKTPGLSTKLSCFIVLLFYFLIFFFSCVVLPVYRLLILNGKRKNKVVFEWSLAWVGCFSVVTKFC